MAPQKQAISWSLPTKETSWAPTSPLAIMRSFSLLAAASLAGCVAMGGERKLRVGGGAPLVTFVTVVLEGTVVLPGRPPLGSTRRAVFFVGAAMRGLRTSVLMPLLALRIVAV